MAAVLSLIAAGALGAQSNVPANASITIPLAEGARRRPDLEKAREAAAGDGHTFWVYRWEGPMEPLVRYYIQRLAGDRDGDLDSTSVRPGGTSNIVYHIQFWTFMDECADSTPGAAGAAPCTHWRRATDLKRGLGNRLPLAPGAWVEHCIFHWFSRDEQGALTRWTADVFDSGMTPDWKHYEPTADLIIESDQVKGAATQG
ncbi:MAG TPA: hypothetical protein VN848_12185 [Gemmatimonadales bacterium]|nr:hypothetical protein [Gemmatimonadales bacterium]